MSGTIKRRRIVAAALASVSALSSAADAQPVAGTVKRIGILSPLAPGDRDGEGHLAEFRTALAQRGWIEGRTLRLDTRWAAGDGRLTTGYARELVALQPDAIFVRSTPAARAVLRETRSIPVVFVIVSDPVGDGIVHGLTRPGTNATGFTNVEASMAGKWLQILRELVPGLSEVTCLFNPDLGPGGGNYYLRLLEAAGGAMGVTVAAAPVRDEPQIVAAIAALGARPGSAAVVTPDPTTTSNSRRIVAEMALHRVPAVYSFPEIAVAGGLVSYGADVGELHRRAAIYLDRILRVRRSTTCRCSCRRSSSWRSTSAPPARSASRSRQRSSRRPKGSWNEARSAATHAGLMLALRITLAHFSVSSAISLVSSAGAIGMGAPPRSAKRSFIRGSARPALISR